jgi:hypothetical protein
MSDELFGVDQPRALPPELRDRLAASLRAATAVTTAPDTAVDGELPELADVDAPRSLVPATRQRIRSELTAATGVARRRRAAWIGSAAAAAVLAAAAVTVPALLDRGSAGRPTVQAGSHSPAPSTSTPHRSVDPRQRSSGRHPVPAPSGVLQDQTSNGNELHKSMKGTWFGANRLATTLSAAGLPGGASALPTVFGPTSGGTTVGVTVDVFGVDRTRSVWFGDVRSPSMHVDADGRVEAVSPPAAKPGRTVVTLRAGRHVLAVAFFRYYRLRPLDISWF